MGRKELRLFSPQKARCYKFHQIDLNFSLKNFDKNLSLITELQIRQLNSEHRKEKIFSVIKVAGTILTFLIIFKEFFLMGKISAIVLKSNRDFLHKSVYDNSPLR